MRRLAQPTALPALLLVSTLLFAACGDQTGAPESTDEGHFDAARSFADLEAQVEIGPRPSGSAQAREAAALIADELDAAGAKDVVIQGPWRNVLGTLPGSEPGTVIVGAHYDTKSAIPQFVGANDGASGVAVVLELARTLPRPLPGPAVQLVLFDAEEARGSREFSEDGTRGSRQYVELASSGGAEGAVPLEQIRAMVLFDMVGDCELGLPLEANSDADLYELFAGASAQANGSPAPFEGRSLGVSDDHTPFLEAGVPALDLIDFEYGPGPSPGRHWHTPEDTLDKVCAESLDLVGEAALVAIPQIR